MYPSPTSGSGSALALAFRVLVREEPTALLAPAEIWAANPRPDMTLLGIEPPAKGSIRGKDRRSGPG